MIVWFISRHIIGLYLKFLNICKWAGLAYQIHLKKERYGKHEKTGF